MNGERLVTILMDSDAMKAAAALSDRLGVALEALMSAVEKGDHAAAAQHCAEVRDCQRELHDFHRERVVDAIKRVLNAPPDEATLERRRRYFRQRRKDAN